MSGTPALDEESLTLLVMLKRQTKGWGDIARRVYERGSATTVAHAEGLMSDSLFDDTSAWDADLASAAQAVEQWHQAGLRLVTVLNPDFPDRLRDVQQMPPFIFLKGSDDPLEDRQGVAVVGSRRATETSLRAAARIAEDLASAGVVVISGLAAGIDTAAHTAALRVGGRTVAVVGTGLNRAYPAQNRNLQEEIAARGLLVSRFWPDSPPTKFSFPMRNEVMSAWARATCVMQADAKSGARMQARVALQQGRRLYLYEGMHSEEWARAYVSAGRAQFIKGADDILGGNDDVVPDE